MSKLWQNRHKWLMWFWIFNFPLAVVFYFVFDEKILLLYTLILSVYANCETSAATNEAKKSNG